MFWPSISLLSHCEISLRISYGRLIWEKKATHSYLHLNDPCLIQKLIGISTIISKWKQDNCCLSMWLWLSFHYRYLDIYFNVPSAICIAQEAHKNSGPLLKEFKATLETPEYKTRIENLKKRVEDFAVKFPLPGFDDWWLYSCFFLLKPKKIMSQNSYNNRLLPFHKVQIVLYMLAYIDTW